MNLQENLDTILFYVVNDVLLLTQRNWIPCDIFRKFYLCYPEHMEE